MWPYTGEETRWLGCAEPVLSSPAADHAPTEHTATKHTPAQPVATQTIPALITTAEAARSDIRAAVTGKSGGWLHALDRLFKVSDRLSDHGALPLVAARLKDPLNAIRDSAQALRHNPDLSPDQQARHLDVVLRENDHLAEMISAMLDTVGIGTVGAGDQAKHHH